MKVKTLIAAVIETVIKIVVLVLAVMLIYKGISKAYNFGYRVFADKPISSGTGRTITIGISEESDVKDVGAMLKEKGLIEDEDLFFVQELLSSYHGKIKPGIYDLSTNMKVSEMLAIISSGEGSEDMETPSPQSTEEAQSVEDTGMEEDTVSEGDTESVEDEDYSEEASEGTEE